MIPLHGFIFSVSTFAGFAQSYLLLVFLFTVNN